MNLIFVKVIRQINKENVKFVKLNIKIKTEKEKTYFKGKNTGKQLV